MAFDGKYKVVKEENTLEFMKAIGIPDTVLAKMQPLNVTVEICSNGNEYTLKYTEGSNPTKEFTNTVGVEVTDPTGTGEYLKSYTNIENGKLVTKSTAASGNCITRSVELTEEGIIFAISSDSTPIVSKRYLNRIN